MKKIITTRLINMSTLVLAMGTIFSAPPAARAQQNSPISAKITLDKNSTYEKETIYFTLTITTSGIQFRQKLDLTELPAPEVLNLFSKFESLPVRRIGSGNNTTEIHSYRCRARALATGSITIAPKLHLTIMRRRRGFIGNFWEERPITLQVPPTKLTIKPLPPAPANFSGAIGNLNFQASISPRDIVQGDLITLTTRISGPGYTKNIKIPQLKNSTELKTYPPKQTAADEASLTYEQVIIPQTTNLTTIGKISFCWFDTVSGKYKTAVRGPFSIRYHESTASTYENFRPDDIDTDIPSNTDTIATRPNLAHRIAESATTVRYKQANCRKTTDAHLAPSEASLITFSIPTDSKVNILQKYGAWLKVEIEKKRGWIPASAIAN